METINVIMGMILAVAGVVISFIELRRDSKERKREKAASDAEQRLIDEVSNNELDKAIKDFKEALSTPKEKSIKIISTFYTTAGNVCTKYEDCQKSIRQLYKQLLRDESQFSLSYGFERYIVVFRRFLYNDELEKTKQIVSDFQQFNRTLKENDKGPFESILSRVLRINEIWEDHPSFSVEDCNNFHIREMKEQYPGYSQDQNVIEKAIYAYFEKFYKCKKAVLKLTSISSELIVLYKELQLKYGINEE